MADAQEYAERIEAGTRSFVEDVRKVSAQNSLYRSSTNKYIGGVCGGLAERYKVDPTLIRLIFLGLSFTGSIGLWVYLGLWVFLPTDRQIAGELDAIIEDMPPMPKSGPYVDVPGMDPVGATTPKTEDSSARMSSRDIPSTESDSLQEDDPVQGDSADFPKPGTIL